MTLPPTPVIVVGMTNDSTPTTTDTASRIADFLHDIGWTSAHRDDDEVFVTIPAYTSCGGRIHHPEITVRIRPRWNTDQAWKIEAFDESGRPVILKTPATFDAPISGLEMDVAGWDVISPALSMARKAQLLRSVID